MGVGGWAVGGFKSANSNSEWGSPVTFTSHSYHRCTIDVCDVDSMRNVAVRANTNTAASRTKPREPRRSLEPVDVIHVSPFTCHFAAKMPISTAHHASHVRTPLPPGHKRVALKPRMLDGSLEPWTQCPRWLPLACDYTLSLLLSSRSTTLHCC